MKIKLFLLSIVVLVTLGWIAYNNYFKYRNAVAIAFVGPLSGKGAAAGKLMTQAIQLYFDYINQRGGINGKQIILQAFDDQNDPEQARQQALAIVNKNQFIAVIGHWYSSASISGGKIYQAHQIPAITPGSSNIKVTQGNPWYFRNIYNDKATSHFLAHYIKKVFKQDQVTIIHETADYGSYIAETFAKEAQSLAITIKNKWQYYNQDKNLDAVFQHFVEQLKVAKDKAGVILLAMQASEGVKLVKLIKEAGIKTPLIGPSSFSEETFRNGFDADPIERENPGYYSNDIYVATPLLFDTANEKAQLFLEAYKEQYNEEPDWSAAYAYDTAMVLVEALKKAHIEGVPNRLSIDRKKLRDTLASFTNIHDAVKGVTGFNYFDHYRDAQKLVSLGIYKQKNLVSALTQFHVLSNPNEIVDIQQALQDEQVLIMDNQYMYKTHVVYVGIKMNEISHIDMKQLVYNLDFKLWFRFLKGRDFHPTDIQFTNAVDPPKLRAQLAKPIEDCKETLDQIVYCVYRIKGDFRADFLANYYSYKKHVVGIGFRHRTLTRNNLIYVTDMLGMGLNQEKSLAQYLSKTHVLGPAEGWLIDRVWFFPDIAKEYSAGDPQHLNASEGIVEYSRFNAAIQLKQDQLTLRGSIPYKYAHDIMILSGALFLFLAVAASSKKKLSKYIWFFQVIFAFLWLLSGEMIFADWLAQKTNPYQMKHIIRTFDILWWLIPAFLITEALERFIWTPIQETVGAIPNIIRHFFALFVYLLAIVGITVFVYEQQFTSLLATSSVLAMIVGLAIQINISNVFSGIVINMDRPFRIGDWIKIGEFDEGEVIDINWRATRLKRRDGCMLSIPNSQAAEAAIINFYYPEKVYWLWPTIYVHPKHPPFRVKKILQDALLSADKILHDPEPVVIFTGINEWAATYWIAFCADNYADKYSILESVWTRVWFHLNRADIAPAVMRQEIYIFKGEKNSDPAPSSKTPPFKQAEETFRSAPFLSTHSLINQG